MAGVNSSNYYMQVGRKPITARIRSHLLFALICMRPLKTWPLVTTYKTNHGIPENVCLNTVHISIWTIDFDSFSAEAVLYFAEIISR
jgi:hypothetical protein